MQISAALFPNAGVDARPHNLTGDEHMFGINFLQREVVYMAVGWVSLYHIRP